MRAINYPLSPRSRARHRKFFFSCLIVRFRANARKKWCRPTFFRASPARRGSPRSLRRSSRAVARSNGRGRCASGSGPETSAGPRAAPADLGMETHVLKLPITFQRSPQSIAPAARRTCLYRRREDTWVLPRAATPAPRVLAVRRSSPDSRRRVLIIQALIRKNH